MAIISVSGETGCPHDELAGLVHLVFRMVHILARTTGEGA